MRTFRSTDGIAGRRRAVPPCLLAAAAAGLLLTGCGSSSSDPAAAGTTSGAGSPTSASSTASAGLTLKDGWIKAVPTGMTAIFGTLDNASDQPVTVMSGSSPAAGKVELHEVVDVDGAMKMRPKPGGFVIPAHGNHELKPGGDHIMLMDLTGPVKAGDIVTATLTLSGGATVEVTALGKDFAGANESYAGGSSGSMSGETSPSTTP